MDTPDPPKDEIERRARDLAQRVMAKPHEPRLKPKDAKAPDERASARKRARPVAES